MKKKINLLLFFITVSFSINAQAITTTYTTRNFGSSLSQASNQFCSTNAITNGYNFRVNVISTTLNPLQTNKLYKFLDENTVYYIYVVSKNTNIDNDRDSFGLDNFELQNITCTYETGYNIRDLGTNYTTASNLVCSSSASTSGNSYRINVLSQIPTNPLQTNKLYKFTDDNIVKYLYIVSKMSAPASDTDSYYENNYIIQNPFCDSDSDGIEDSIDNCKTVYNPNQLDTDGDGIGNLCDRCPNIYGNLSNFGCFGNPDLAIYKSSTQQYSDCYACNGTLDQNNGTPTIYRYGGNITLYPLVIKNIGNGNVSNTIGSIKIKFYLSVDQSLNLNGLNQPGNDIDFSNRTVTIGNTIAGGTSSVNVSIEGSDIGDRVPYGNYYLIIHIDSDNVLGNSEPNKANNKYYLPVRYTGTLPNNRLSNKELERIESIDDVPLKSYIINIYDFSGTLIKFSTINSIEQESKIISTLPSGLYIIKTPLETRKISK